MKQVFRDRRGHIVLGDVPAPELTPGRILVRVLYSVISSGTETRALQSTSKNFSQKILNPLTIIRTIRKAKTPSVTSLYKNLKTNLSNLAPLGYSAAGSVIAVADDVRGLKVGDLVACMGAEYAYHAEIISVPRQMATLVPSSTELREASFVTLGAIALHAVRNAHVQLGDTVGVAGLGLIGQLVVQFLKLSGARVIGFDKLSNRIDLAKQHGLDDGVVVSATSSFSNVMKFTEDRGLDAVIICTTTNDHHLLEKMASVCRDRARFIVVGIFDVHIPYALLYRKELTVLVSRSTGPGRHDGTFETRNIDYPPGYVRWTQRSNAEEFIRLLSEKKISVQHLISKVYDMSRAKEAYYSLLEGEHLGILLRYEAHAL